MRDVAGGDAVVHAVHGLTKPEFPSRARRSEARAALGLPRDGKVVLVSGGGWGVGDLEGAVDAALGVEQRRAVVCLCGRNEGLRARWSSRATTRRAACA